MTTALYRRYRPDSFGDVIGQEHVTEPLMTALRKNRVNHAYLFSGPRGCGKTTSARILARCLNCAQGPTGSPCGHCESCVELATGGPGSLDVIEIDAASHGGVDDARDLRERATFAPVRDRYKIFIIDEAHMVTSAGFNALLKIVEEPPEHIKFIFATTEPDKVIGTIRSRTHHYPFRLVPPEPLMTYLNTLCQREQVPVAPGVLSLVIRAGGGSVRDTLSVLDQLMAGAGEQGLDYELAVSLLGYTHASLLDDIVDALASSDAGTVFRAVDRVIQTGLDPRRFVEDLLERFRDLIIVQALPENAPSVLRGVPENQIATMRNQATQLGRAELSRAADVSNTALNEMTGATSPRLHLELLCARLLFPGAEHSERGMASRLDRIERRLSYSGDTSALEAPTAAGNNTAPAPVPETHACEVPVATFNTSAPVSGVPASPQAAQNPVRKPQSAPEPQSVTAPWVDSGAPAEEQARATHSDGIEMLRRAWPDILAALGKIKRSSWALVYQDATPLSFDGQTLRLGFSTEGLAGRFNSGEHSENLRSAISSTLGLDCHIAAGVGTDVTTPSGTGRGVGPNPKTHPAKADPEPGSDTAPQPLNPQPARPEPDRASSTSSQLSTNAEPSSSEATNPESVSAKVSGLEQPKQASTPEPVIDAWPELAPIPGEKVSGTPGASTPPEPRPDPPQQQTGAAPQNTAPDSERNIGNFAVSSGANEQPMHPRERVWRSSKQSPASESNEDVPSPDDETIEESHLMGRAAVERILGGKLIEERPVEQES